MINADVNANIMRIPPHMGTRVAVEVGVITVPLYSKSEKESPTTVNWR